MSSDRLSAEPPVSQGSGSSCWKKKVLLVSRIQPQDKMYVWQGSLSKTFICFSKCGPHKKPKRRAIFIYKVKNTNTGDVSNRRFSCFSFPIVLHDFK